MDFWFVGSMVGLIGWLTWWCERGERKRLSRLLTRQYSVIARYERQRMHDLHEAYQIGAVDWANRPQARAELSHLPESGA